MKPIPTIDVDFEFFGHYGTNGGSDVPKHVYFFRNGYGARVFPVSVRGEGAFAVMLLKGNVQNHEPTKRPTPNLKMDEGGIAIVFNDDELRELLEDIGEL